jgi:hypothetical protein
MFSTHILARKSDKFHRGELGRRLRPVSFVLEVRDGGVVEILDGEGADLAVDLGDALDYGDGIRITTN